MDLYLPAERVTRVWGPIIEWRGKPICIRCDNGPEFIWYDHAQVVCQAPQPAAPVWPWSRSK
ncbi:hypothetical protein E8K88_04165 [Lampropedia aestuarii]|uniref:Transposase family protein n=1 Tax=Lampropedia aestuarii TaxID=2562762 RepID=A0A4S5BS15_9BURK|nr:hypothetical protein E8K88_04165 [Lampropedia aestuarii]